VAAIGTIDSTFLRRLPQLSRFDWKADKNYKLKAFPSAHAANHADGVLSNLILMRDDPRFIRLLKAMNLLS